MKKKILVTLIVIACAAGLFVARARQEKYAAITYVETASGQIEPKGKRVRIVDLSTGQWRETDYAPDGKDRGSMIVSRQGIFVVREKHIELKDAFAPPRPLSADSLTKNATATEQIAGYTAYCNKAPSGSVEIWESAELRDVPLRVIMHGGTPGSFTQLEAVEVSWQPGAPETFALPDLPLDTSPIERRLEMAREKNDQRAVKRYSDLLARWKR